MSRSENFIEVEDRLTPKQRELYDLMSQISEDSHCAGWLTGNEYSIWADLISGKEDSQLDECRRLSKEIDGWITWVDDDQYPTLPVEEWGPRFVPKDQWLEMVERR